MRHRAYRANRSAEKKTQDNALAKLRNQQYRARKKANNIITNKKVSPKRPLTRKEIANRRTYWRLQKQRLRASYSNQKIRRLREKRNARYQKQKLSNQVNVISTSQQINTPSNRLRKLKHICLNVVNESLPKTPEKYADIIVNIVKSSTPRRLQALNNRGIILQSKNKVKRNLSYKQALGKLAETITTLKTARSTEDLKKRRDLAKSLLILKKYKTLKPIAKELNISYRYILKSEQILIRKKRKDALLNETLTAVKDYYERPDVSIELPTKKTVATKTFIQKRILEKSLSEVYQEFRNETKIVMSLSKFIKLRPKHVLTFSHHYLNQCLCEKCINITHMANAINLFAQKHNLPECNVGNKFKFLNLTMCDKGEYIFNKPECINRVCKDCGTHKLDNQLTGLMPFYDENITWNKWEKTLHTYIKNGDELTKSKLGLVTKSGSLGTLYTEFKNELNVFSLHRFISKWQHQQFLSTLKLLNYNMVIIVMDFAENYGCEMQDEIQSNHWCHEQITIHPIVAYYLCQKCPETVTESIVIISDDLIHDGHAVHHFTSIVNKNLNQGKIKKQLQWCDNCAVQYKSKIPFSDISHANEDHSFLIERNYFGERHGKGPCDGLGGVVKSKVFAAVKARRAIVRCAQDMFHYCNENMTIESEECNHKPRKFFMVKRGEINRSRKDREVLTVKGTRAFHSVKSVRNNEIAVRNLSCYCLPCTTSDYTFCENKQYLKPFRNMKLNLTMQNILHVIAATEETPVATKKTTAETPTTEVTIHETESQYLKTDDFIKMIWNQKEYVAQVKLIEDTQILVSFMEENKTADGVFFWPSTPDTSWEPITSIIQKLSLPVLCEKRSTNRKQFLKFI